MALLSDQELLNLHTQVHAHLLRLDCNAMAVRNPESLPVEESEDPRARAQANKIRDEHCQDIDLVAKALQDPKSLDDPQRMALLGRPAYDGDATAFLRFLPGYQRRRMATIDSFRRDASEFQRFIHFSPELCKFTICDWRVPQDFGGADNNATTAIESLYQDQLRLERERSPLELAREAVRDSCDQRARFYARRVLREYELAQERGEDPNPCQIWGRFRPMIPLWIWRIQQNKEDYGFAIYKSYEAEQRPLQAIQRWMRVFNEEERSNGFGGYREACYTVRMGRPLYSYMFPGWVENCESHPASENSPSALRR